MTYHCSGCGYRSAQWLGFCPRCRDHAGLEATAPASTAVALITDVDEPAVEFRSTGIAEFDRVLGGGLAAGVALLVAGEPGVGKSTLLLQVAAAVAADHGAALVASGEESPRQVGSRGRRIGADHPALRVMAATATTEIIAAAAALDPSVVVVDSIQTIVPGSGDAIAGSPTAVRVAAAELVAWGKATGTPVVLIGHVNKDGAIAGPKVLEHVVDVVTSLDGDHQRDLRILRCRKNRYGPTSRVGLFRLTAAGMVEIDDPSTALVGGWQGDVPGSVAFPAVEGGRPVTVEIQALVAPAHGQAPRRSVRGIDSARLHQLLAVLESHCGLRLGRHDVYVGVSGGLRLREPAADLPVALALASSAVGRPLGRIGAWGEVGLTGEIRGVPHDEWRRDEGQRIGLTGFLAPAGGMRRIGAVLAAAGLT
jgi:DNA repair protein RadA/Sms